MSLESSVTELVEEASTLINVFKQRRNEIEQALQELSESAITPVTGTVNYSVGPTGDFATLNEAFEVISNTRSAILNGAVSRVIVTLQSGFVMQEQLLFQRNIDLSFSEIRSEDSEVPVDPTYLTASFYGGYPVFGGASYAKLPKIYVLFRMLATGRNNTHYGASLNSGSQLFFGPGCGVADCGGHGAYVAGQSIFSASSSDFSGAGLTGIFITSNSFGYVAAANVSGAGESGLHCREVSIAHAPSLEATNVFGVGISLAHNSLVHAYGANVESLNNNGVYSAGSKVTVSNGNIVSGGGYALYSLEGGNISGTGVTCRGGATACVYAARGSIIDVTDGDILQGTEPGSSDITVSHGGTIITNKSTVGGTNIALNTLTANGVIYQQ